MITKMKNLRALFALFLFSIIATIIGCKDIIEDDLSDRTITINAPLNGLVTTTLTHTFWWNKIEYATKYQLQIVSPSFIAVEKLILDTNISTNQFQYTLTPDTFEWRVRAYNNSSTTAFVTYTIIIDSTANLDGQQVVLISPVANFATNQLTQAFKWYELYNADDYRFEIRSPDWNGSLVYNPVITAYDTISFTLPEGSYTWGVQAQNVTSSSQFSTRTLIIDNTNPNIPTLQSPVNGATVYDSTLTNSTIIFRWKRGYDSGSTIHDSLYLAKDSIFSIANTELAISLTDTTYSYPMQTTGTYYWKVKSIDAAGNKSSFCTKWKFVYQ